MPREGIPGLPARENGSESGLGVASDGREEHRARLVLQEAGRDRGYLGMQGSARHEYFQDIGCFSPATPPSCSRTDSSRRAKRRRQGKSRGRRTARRISCRGERIMSDLKKYIEERKKRDPELDYEYDEGYEQFKIGMMIREARESAGLSQEELAKRLQTKKTAITRIENHAEDIKLSTLERVAASLGKRLEGSIVPVAGRKVSDKPYGDAAVRGGEIPQTRGKRTKPPAYKKTGGVTMTNR